MRTAVFVIEDGWRRTGYGTSRAGSDSNFERCFQVMEADSEAILKEWTANWDDLTDFEIGA